MESLENFWSCLCHLRDAFIQAARSQYVLIQLVSHLHSFVDLLSEATILMNIPDASANIVLKCKSHISQLCGYTAELVEFCDRVHHVQSTLIGAAFIIILKLNF